MARARIPREPIRKSRAPVDTDLPKRKPGRPLGSTKAKAALAAGAKATGPAARVAKPNKAALQAHVAKLERTITRLREKNKELKLAMTTAQDRADALETRLEAVAPAKAAKPARRSSRKPAQAEAAEPAA